MREPVATCCLEMCHGFECAIQPSSKCCCLVVFSPDDIVFKRRSTESRASSVEGTCQAPDSLAHTQSLEACLVVRNFYLARAQSCPCLSRREMCLASFSFLFRTWASLALPHSNTARNSERLTSKCVCAKKKTQHQRRSIHVGCSLRPQDLQSLRRSAGLPMCPRGWAARRYYSIPIGAD